MSEENNQNQTKPTIPELNKNTNLENSPPPVFPNIQKRIEIPPTPPSPPQIKEEKKEPTPPKTKISPQSFLIRFLGFGGLLITIFYILVFWGTYQGTASNPFFETLGIEASGLKDLLLMMTNFIFGIIGLFMLITTLIYLFRGIITAKDSFNKKTLLTKSGIYLIIFLGICGLWVFLYWFISTLNNGEKKPETINNSLIITNPKNVVGLSAPIKIEFNIGTNLYKEIPQESIRQINWDFNNDNIFDASGPAVTHRFIEKGAENKGRFPVIVKIDYFSKKEGKEVSFYSTKEVIISNEAVSAKLSTSPESGTYPLQVELNGLGSKDPDGEIILYEWDLDNDGEFEIKQESPILNKLFSQVGEYKVKLRVTGTNHDIDIVEKTITVKSPQGNLHAEISSSEPLEGITPLKIALDGTQSFVKEGKIIRYEWFIEGDSEVFVGRKFQRVLRKPGEYKVSLTIQNDLGEKHKDTKIIKVLEDNSKVSLKIKTTPSTTNKDNILRGIVPFEVSFDSTDSEIKEVLEWQWDFENDGIADKFSEAVKHNFREPGLYEVKLIIIDSEEVSHEKIQKVLVERSGIKAKINANPNSGEIPLPVTFDGSGSSTDAGEIVDYIWEFPGETPIHYGAKITYLFKNIGNNLVKLTVLTSKGKIATTETIVSVRIPIVKADFNFTPKKGTAPLEIKLNPILSKGLIQEYFWDFGDGFSQKQINANPITHEYQKAGTYKIKLRLLDTNNLISESTKTIEIKEAK